MSIYIVKPNDTLDTIADAYNLPPDQIAYDNQIPYPYPLAEGEALYIQTTLAVAPTYQIYTGGYAYPFINNWVLTNTLPYLTYLYDFSYGFTMEGELVPPAYDDTRLIDTTLNSRAVPILTLTPFGPDGRFNNNLISSVVNNYEYRENLTNALIEVLNEKNFSGVDIDFEYILASDKNAFTEFVSYIKESIAPLQYTLSVALAPKTSGTQKGLLYEGKDYPALGAIADYVLLMTYEWGYKYGPPLAVAPIPKVREVLDYAVSVIPADKIHLGIPNYGYDWPLPYVRNTTEATTIGNIEAVQIAIQNEAVIMYDEESMAPYFNYYVNGTEHVVWFEDVRSIQAKFDLVKEYNLRGISYWQIMQLYRANWLLQKDNFLLADYEV